MGARFWVGRQHNVALMEFELVPDCGVRQAGVLLSLLLWEHWGRDGRHRSIELRHAAFLKLDGWGARVDLEWINVGATLQAWHDPNGFCLYWALEQRCQQRPKQLKSEKQ